MQKLTKLEKKSYINGVIASLLKVIPCTETKRLSLNGASPLHSQCSAPVKSLEAHSYVGVLGFSGCKDPKAAVEQKGKTQSPPSQKGSEAQGSPRHLSAQTSLTVLPGLPPFNFGLICSSQPGSKASAAHPEPHDHDYFGKSKMLFVLVVCQKVLVISSWAESELHRPSPHL